MAGDWIKMRVDLRANPKVVRIASALKADRLRTVGGLYSAWCLFDAYSVDGRMEGYTLEILDEEIGFPGFAGAMKSVGWLEETPQGLVMPRFDAHNGQSAKRRAQDADRKKVSRMSASEADELRTREEKRREENKKTLSSGDDSDESESPKAEKTKAQPIPYDAIFDVYEQTLCVEPYNRPRVKIRDDKRKNAIKRIVKLRPKAVDAEWWRGYFSVASESEHWMNGSKLTGGTWDGANFDFLLRDDNFKKILEKYS